MSGSTINIMTSFKCVRRIARIIFPFVFSSRVVPGRMPIWDIFLLSSSLFLLLLIISVLLLLEDKWEVGKGDLRKGNEHSSGYFLTRDKVKEVSCENLHR